MQVTNDVEFTHRGHRVQVSRRSILVEYQGANDMMFTVLIDGHKVDVPGVWSAYKKASIRGVELVIMALLDGQPVRSAANQ